MKTHADKTQQNKNNAPANFFSNRQKSSKLFFQSKDRQRGGITQKNQQGILNNSSEAAPLNFLSPGYRAITDAETEDAAEFYVRDEYAYPTLGFTSRPRDHDGPDINFNPEEREDGQWFVTPVRNGDSDEGNNDSWSLGAGDQVIPGEVENGLQVHAIVSDEMAASIMAAENEHTGDYRFAAARILERADAWLDANLDALGNDGEFGPAGSEEEAEALAEAAINPALQAHLDLTGVPAEDFTWANLPAYYGLACTQTEKRDDNLWHSFDRDIEEMEDRVNHTITPGNTQINEHPAAEVIILPEVGVPGDD